MAEQDFRLLGGTLALGRFTTRELARFAGVGGNTASSWLSRNGKFIERVPAEEASTTSVADGRRRRGRPEVLWRVRQEQRTELHAVLERLYPMALRASDPAHASELVLQLRKAVDDGLGRARKHLRGAYGAQDADVAGRERAASAACASLVWDDLADFAALDAENGAAEAVRVALDAAVDEVARFEEEAGMLDVPPTRCVRGAASWLASWLNCATERGWRPAFALRVVRARARRLSSVDQGVLTAAALAASIWSEEDGEQALSRASAYADEVRGSGERALLELLKHVSTVLDTGGGSASIQ